MDDLLLHPRTKAELTALLTDAPHALMLVAPSGTGKRTVARNWGERLADKTGVSVLEPDEKGTITIDATRALYQRTRAKQAGHQVVIIDHAESMSGEAQNAFLKLLEEPRPGLTFILTASDADDMLPTIQSRLQVVQIHPVSAQALGAEAKRLRPGIDDQTLAQLLFVANGRPATLLTMLEDEKAFEHHKQIMQKAKLLLSAGQYERLAMVQELTKDKGELTATLEAVAHMLKLQMLRDSAFKWVAVADSLQECLRRLRQNGNARAQLVHFFMTY
jgi:replication-associated recombination protein RarA